MNTLQQLFDYRLQNIYTAEYELLDVLQDLAVESTDSKLRRAFAEQRNQTMRHIKRLERVFKIRGRQPTEIRCPELEGIVRMKKGFTEERPTPPIRDTFNTEVGQKIQHFQVASYESLANMASRMDMATVAKLLRDNLQEEKSAMYELNLLTPRTPVTTPAEKAGAGNGKRGVA